MNWFLKIFGIPLKTSKKMAPQFTSKPPNFQDFTSSQNSMSVNKISAENMQAFGEILCDGYELTGTFNLDEIYTFIKTTEKSHPNYRLLGTLDDFDQACYTFGHACGKHLNEEEDDDIPWEDLPTTEKFERRKEYFNLKLADTALESILGKRYWIGQENESPSILTSAPAKHERQSYVQIVPARKACSAIIAFPNGYFSDDYSPFENYRLAEHLENKFGFKLFGIGASYLGFISEKNLDDTKLRQMSTFLSLLFSTNNNHDLPQTIFDTLKGQTRFYFCYGGG